MTAMRARLPRTGPAIQALLLVEEGEEGVVNGDGEDRGDDIEDELVDEAKHFIRRERISTEDLSTRSCARSSER
jgi:hypothetical protein